jgi:DNA-binding NtrC family response regulator
VADHTHRLLNIPMNLHAAERLLVESALRSEGSIVGAAGLLGITRHALKRRIIKYQLDRVDGRRTRPEAS